MDRTAHGREMPSNIEVLRSGYEAFGRGDIGGITDTFDEDIEFVGPSSQQVPGAGTQRGKEAVGALLASMQERARLAGATFRIESALGRGTRLVVIARARPAPRVTEPEG